MLALQICKNKDRRAPRPPRSRSLRKGQNVQNSCFASGRPIHSHSPFMGPVAPPTSNQGGVTGYRRDIVAALRPLILGFVLVPLTSCMVGPNYKTPQASVEAQWMGVPSNRGHRTKIAQAYWWKCFRDPVLDRLIRTAYANNPSLQATAVRILQARAQLNYAVGNLFPQQQALSGGVNYTRLSTPDRAFVPANVTSNFIKDQILFPPLGK